MEGLELSYLNAFRSIAVFGYVKIKAIVGERDGCPRFQVAAGFDKVVELREFANGLFEFEVEVSGFIFL